MSELFTQNYSDKPLFHTDTDISESLHNQVDEASNGEELLNNTEKQAESLLSNDDYVSETKNSLLLVILISIVAAVFGSIVLYIIGYYIGTPILDCLNKKIPKTEKYTEKAGEERILC